MLNILKYLILRPFMLKFYEFEILDDMNMKSTCSIEARHLLSAVWYLKFQLKVKRFKYKTKY